MLGIKTLLNLSLLVIKDLECRGFNANKLAFSVFSRSRLILTPEPVHGR